MKDYQVKKARRMYQDIKDLPDELQDKLTQALINKGIETSLEREKQVEVIPASDLIDKVEERNKYWNQVIGLRTGYPTLDKMTMGLAPGEMTVVGGRTSSGKTALAINVCANLLKQDIPVLFVTLEMTQTEVASRFSHLLGEDTFLDKSSLLYFQENDDLDWKSVDRLIEYAKQDCGVGAVVIDHLHYFTRELEHVSEDLGRITKEFKKNAIRHEIPVILISHTRKTSNSALSNDDLRGSSYVAQDADIVLMIAQDEDFDNKITISLTKNRNRLGVERVPIDATFRFEGTKIQEST